MLYVRVLFFVVQRGGCVPTAQLLSYIPGILTIRYLNLDVNQQRMNNNKMCFYRVRRERSYYYMIRRH